MLANDRDDPSNDLVTPGISDFQQASRRIELCAPRARIREGRAQVSIAGWVYDSTLLECFAYDIHYRQGVSVGTLEELVGCALLTALENEDLRKERLKQRKPTAAKRTTHLPSVDVTIDILFVDIARGA